MEIAECFEEWDPDNEDNETISLDSLLLGGEEEEVEESDCSGSEEDENEDDESLKKLKCCKCQKVYHTSGWLKRHEESCSGAIGKARKRKPEKLSEHQRKTRAILADLGFEEYFDCLPAILHFLKEITCTKSDIVKLRGKRFADSQRQADFLFAELEKGTENEVTVLYERINRHRSESVVSALQICEEYIGETLQKRPFLIAVENNIVAYIAGYVCGGGSEPP